MISMSLLVLAQQEAPRPGGSIMGLLVPMILMFVMFHFLLIRPQKRKQQELQKQIDAVQIGDAVVTSGGLHGIIANKTDHTVTIKVADNVKIKFDKVAIARIISKERAAASASPEPGEAKES